jgi:hypothetical protein
MLRDRNKFFFTGLVEMDSIVRRHMQREGNRETQFLISYAYAATVPTCLREWNFLMKLEISNFPRSLR